MSMEAFINGRSVISSSGGFAVPTPAEQRNHEMKLARIKLSSSSSSSSMSYDNTGYASHANITINSNANNATNDGSLTNNKNNNNNEGDDCDTNNIVLAERTSQLMSSYRNYILEQDDEEALTNRIYSEEGSCGNTSHFKEGIRERSSTTNTSSSNNNSNQNQLYSDAPLLREWNSNGSTSRCELEMEDMMNNGDVDSYHKKYRYSHPVFHSKKFKKTMLAIIVVGAVLLAVLIVVRNDRKSALSDWEEELQDVLLLHEEEEEEGDNVVGSESESSVLLHDNVGIGVDLVPVNHGGTQESVSETATRLPEDDGEEYEDGGAGTNTNKAEQDERAQDDNNENSHLSMASFDVKEADNNESQNSQPMEMIQEVLNKEKEDQDKPAEDATTESKEEGADDEETASVGGVALPEIVVNPKAAEGNDDVDMDVDEEENASDEGSPEEGEQTTEDNAESSTSEPVNNSNNIEAITRHIMCCSSIAPNTANNNNDNPPPTTSAATNSEEKPDRAKRSAAEDYARAESHRPIWYNRSSGWYGTSYQEGIDFCASQKQLGDDNANNNANNNAKRMMQLCPYEAYCPMGANHIPLGGFRVDTAENGYGGSGLGSGSSAAVSVSGSRSSSRSPIADYQDGWVQVGSDNACLQYTILDGKDGGGDDDNLDDEMQLDANVVGTTDNVKEQGVIGSMVGHQSMTVEPGPSSVTEGLVVKSKEDQEQQQDVAAIPVTLHQPEEPAMALQTSTINNNSPTTNIANANTVTTAFQQQQQHVDMTNILHQKFKPLWISTHEGWNGGSHDDAVRLCASIRGKKLCPYSAMCPHGPGSAVMGGQKHLEFEVEGEQYAPVLGGENHWVMIGSGGEGEEENALSSSSRKCMTHRQLEGRAPEWGLNGDRAEVKQHIMCCTIS